MRPVRTARSNFVWTGPTPDVGDLHAIVARNADGVSETRSVWEPSPHERKRIADGANIALDVWGMHPPANVSVTDEQGVGEDAPEIHGRLEEWQASQAARS